jgi:poly-gamma-glutamate synthesis protein (capsule biosynthesis protein)
MLSLTGPVFAAPRELVITFGGDVNFARSRVPPLVDHVRKFGRYTLKDVTRNIAHEFDGDLNFVNVETVVAERNGSMVPKTFVFRTHPQQMRHLLDLGVNTLSLANNHAYDHGWSGLRDTLGFFEREAQKRSLLFAGIGSGEKVFEPQIKTFNGLRVAFSAIGIGSSYFAADQDGAAGPGMVTLFQPGQYDRLLQRMARAKADLKILSIHFGTENMIQLNPGQRAMFRRAVEEAGVHLVLGHHPHVPRAVETGTDHAIFYSLGNFLFIGGADRDHLRVGHDYGLFGKAYFSFDRQGARLSAVEVLPLRNVDLAPEPMTPLRTRQTLAHLSRLSRSSVGDRGLQIAPISDTAIRGAVCYKGPYGPRTLELCCSISHRAQCDLPDLM